MSDDETVQRRVVGTYTPASLFTHCDFEQWEIDKAIDEKDPEFYYVNSAPIHEWIHQVQILTTTFGRQLMMLSLFSGLAISRTIQRYIQGGGFERLRRPLIANLFFDKEMRAAMSEKELAGLYMGALVNQFMGGVHDEAMNEFVFPDEYTKGISAPNNTPCPRITISEKRIDFGAMHILEAFAHENEFLFILSAFDREVARKFLINSFVYPYDVVKRYMRTELGSDGNYPGRVLLLCDIALNGRFPSGAESGEIAWEDVHPGWRFVRSVEYLKRNRQEKEAFDVDKILDLRTKIMEHYGWPDPWCEHERDFKRNPVDIYLHEALELRTHHPVSPVVGILDIQTLKKFIPMNVGPIKAPPNLENALAFLGDKFTPAERFSGFMDTAMVSQSVNELMYTGDVICPIHDRVFGEDAGCMEGCRFEAWFGTIFGFSVQEYARIPGVSAEDVERWRNE